MESGKGKIFFSVILPEKQDLKSMPILLQPITHHGSFGYKGKYEDKFKMKQKNGTKN